MKIVDESAAGAFEAEAAIRKKFAAAHAAKICKRLERAVAEGRAFSAVERIETPLDGLDNTRVDFCGCATAGGHAA